MSQSEKAAYFNSLKGAGVQFQKHYRDYTTAELKAAYDKLVEAGAIAAPQVTHQVPQAPAAPPAQAAPAPHLGSRQVPAPPVARRDPNEVAGARLNTQPEDEPIRVDPDTGRVWYQEEVLKPAYAKPRGRRVLNYMDTGTETKTVQAGQYVETFEVAGTGPARTAQVKITLPSYQVGIYKDPRFPFRVITYNGNEGFELFEVQRYYGGAELVPPAVKRKYVENVLCYDIRSVIQDIQTQYRQLQLAGKA